MGNGGHITMELNEFIDKLLKIKEEVDRINTEEEHNSITDILYINRLQLLYTIEEYIWEYVEDMPRAEMLLIPYNIRTSLSNIIYNTSTIQIDTNNIYKTKAINYFYYNTIYNELSSILNHYIHNT